MKFKICDCTLRDGGYYTNWDFDKELVTTYLKAVEKIDAIDIIEIGYRSKGQKTYLGEYFYCPNHVLKFVSELAPSKTIAIMLNEKDTRIEDLDDLLGPCKDTVGLVRVAVNPDRFDLALNLAKEIKKMGFPVAFNLMYMSKWINDDTFLNKLKEADGLIDIIYLVDSFGGVEPNEVKSAFLKLTTKLETKIGFHGHNNLEMALNNTIASIEGGAKIVDSTFTGMGRGAGNLKTELLLTYYNAKLNIDVDFNALTSVTNEFIKMQKELDWGTSLPYMISGAYSLPQADVMSWMSKHRHSVETIVGTMKHRLNKDEKVLPTLSPDLKFNKAVIIGGGKTVKDHLEGIKIFLAENKDATIIFAGVRYIEDFKDLSNSKYCCLVGSEINKLGEKQLNDVDINGITFVISKSPREMKVMLPENESSTFETQEFNFPESYKDSLFAISFEIGLEGQAKEIYVAGFDGYPQTRVKMSEVAEENQFLIDEFAGKGQKLFCLTPSLYKNMKEVSVYSVIN